MAARSGLKPKGALSRIAPDFFADYMATGGYWIEPVGGPHGYFVTISLFNDSKIGEALKVYGITSGDDVGLGTFMYSTFGTPLGALIGQCRNIRFDMPPPVGQIWALQDNAPAINSPYPNPLPVNPTVLGEPGFSSATLFSPFPIAIVPAGYSLVIANAQSCSTIYAAFWYQVVGK